MTLRPVVLCCPLVSKSNKIAAMVAHCQGTGIDPHFAAYFDYFNRRLFYEAHDVLEHLWLPVRKTPEGPFYKGLIQLAGAFVHLQKNRPGPAVALLRLARANLITFAPANQGFNVDLALSLIDQWVPCPDAVARLAASPPRLAPPTATSLN